MAVADRRFRAMASEVHILVDGDRTLLDLAQARVEELEGRWSRFRGDSDISRLNDSGGIPVAVHADTIVLLGRLRDAWSRSRGSFDPSVLPALRSVGYLGETGEPVDCGPSPMTGLVIEEDLNAAALPIGATLDPGGLGKGLAADLVARDLVTAGARGALVNIGGDLRAAGQAGPWPIVVEDPDDPELARARFAIVDGGVATSSTRSRRWRHGGAEHHHVIDPTSRRPADTDVATATVVAPTAWLAEALATRALILGSERGLADLLDQGVDGLIIDRRGAIHHTPRLAQAGPMTGAAA